MSDIDDSLKLIIRDKINDDLLENIIPTVDCIIATGCKWYGDDDEFAAQIADCMHEHVDYSDNFLSFCNPRRFKRQLNNKRCTFSKTITLNCQTSAHFLCRQSTAM